MDIISIGLFYGSGRAKGGREHTEVRALDPGRSKSSCLSLFTYFYTIINSRRKKVIPRPVKRNVAFYVQGDRKKVAINGGIQTNIKDLEK